MNHVTGHIITNVFQKFISLNTCVEGDNCNGKNIRYHTLRSTTGRIITNILQKFILLKIREFATAIPQNISDLEEIKVV